MGDEELLEWARRLGLATNLDVYYWHMGIRRPYRELLEEIIEEVKQPRGW